jgi:hypothetical protein
MIRFGLVSGDYAVAIEQSQLLIVWQISIDADRYTVL